ncbi:hypothetical protein QYE76_040127 [Lolium multiflorum]|uniref:Uncharacterized protein n=1 Tax=Lolium multiflorum TaxID=4521 RepID=A0AAD8WSX7_LOLMU|nr:hypothetical protein QYE76_040127 [Lolium multiflorum]
MIRRSNGQKEANGWEEGSIITSDESASAITQGRSLDYDPREDEVVDEEEVDDTVLEKNVKVSRKKRSGFKKTSKRRKSPETSTTMPPGRVFGVAPGGSKRLLEVEEPARTRVTKQKPNAIPVTNDKVISANADKVVPATGDNEEQLLHLNEDSLLHMGDGYHSMDEASTGQMQLSPLAPNAGISEEPEEPCTVTAARNYRNGKGLERLTKGLGSKVRIEIAEGMKRPEKPMQAAKLASEGGLIARTLMPILPHFNDYKRNELLMKNFANFEMDSEAKVNVDACTDILKNVCENRRHHVKKKYFDEVEASKVSIKSPVPYITDVEWQNLTTLWSTPRHKAKMEEKLAAPVPDGEVPKSDVEIVSDVLTEKCPSSTFLKNVGLRSSSSTKSSKSNAAVTAHVHQLEEQLEMSQQQARAMREEMAAMKKKAAEAEAAQAEHDKSLEQLLKRTEENDAKFLYMMAMLAGKPTGN